MRAVACIPCAVNPICKGNSFTVATSIAVLERADLLPAFAVGAGGWVPRAQWVPSPHCDARPVGQPISLVVIHAISLPPGVFGGPDVLRLFSHQLDATVRPEYETLQGLQVSAHFFIRRRGELIQCVSCDQRAWHAGVSQWRGRSQCNAWSLGIELEGTDRVPFTLEQYQTLEALLRGLAQRYPLREVVGHEHIAPGRKTDPGPCFQWGFLLRRFPEWHFPCLSLEGCPKGL